MTSRQDREGAARRLRKHRMLACVGTKFRAQRAQGTQKRRRLRQGATVTHQTQGIFLLMNEANLDIHIGSLWYTWQTECTRLQENIFANVLVLCYLEGHRLCLILPNYQDICPVFVLVSTVSSSARFKIQIKYT